MDKTIEELEEELAELKKANILVKIEAEKKLVDERTKEDEDSKLLILRDEMKNEILEEMGVQSNIDEQKPVKLDMKNTDFNEFKDTFCEKNKIEGLTYPELIHKIAYKGYSK